MEGESGWRARVMGHPALNTSTWWIQVSDAGGSFSVPVGRPLPRLSSLGGIFEMTRMVIPGSRSLRSLPNWMKKTISSTGRQSACSMPSCPLQRPSRSASIYKPTGSCKPIVKARCPRVTTLGTQTSYRTCQTSSWDYYNGSRMGRGQRKSRSRTGVCRSFV